MYESGKLFEANYRISDHCASNAQKHTEQHRAIFSRVYKADWATSDTLYTVLYRMAPHRMKAKRATSFVAKSPFHPRRSKQPIFPVPVNALEIEFTDPKSAQKSNPASTNIILEKIGICSVRVYCTACDYV